MSEPTSFQTEHAATEAKATRKPLARLQRGRVISDRTDKTRKVRVSFQSRSPKYGKYVWKRTSFQVHDPDNDARLGDLVEIAPCRPISKTKNWRLVRVLERAPEQPA